MRNGEKGLIRYRMVLSAPLFHIRIMLNSIREVFQTPRVSLGVTPATDFSYISIVLPHDSVQIVRPDFPTEASLCVHSRNARVVAFAPCSRPLSPDVGLCIMSPWDDVVPALRHGSSVELHVRRHPQGPD